jgi:hypothetical protein
VNRTSAAVLSAWAVGLLSLSGVAQALTVPSFNGPGVSPPGYPDFWGANVSATLSQNSNGTFTLSVIGSEAACPRGQTCNGALFNYAGGAYFVSNETMNITANFNANGQFTSGSYSIFGSVPGSSNPTFGRAPSGVSWGPSGSTTLLTATLTGDTIDSSDEALGFNEVITGGWADQSKFTGTPATAESVWLYSLLSGFSTRGGDDSRSGYGNSAWNTFLSELKNGHGLKANTFSAIGSIATVPLPGALILLGSGLLGLGGVARRRRRLSAA